MSSASTHNVPDFVELEARDGSIRRLIDSGPSPDGWSRIEQFIRCPLFFGLVQLGGIRFDPGPPLIRGILLHVGLAHYYQRMKERQDGGDPDAYFTPEESLDAVARERMTKTLPSGEKINLAAEYIPQFKVILDEYQKVWGHERFKVWAVEKMYQLNVKVPGRTPQKFSVRLDLEVQSRRDRIRVWDHKNHHTEGKPSADRYTLSGSFLSKKLVGQYVHGERFGGLYINLIAWSTSKGVHFDRPPIEPAPHREARWATDYVYHREHIDELKRSGMDPWDWPAAINEQTCKSIYGRCPAWELCRWGKASREMALQYEEKKLTQDLKDSVEAGRDQKRLVEIDV